MKNLHIPLAFAFWHGHNKVDWHLQTAEQCSRSRSWVALTDKNRDAYREWVTRYLSCDCGARVGMKLPPYNDNTVLLRDVINGFLVDEALAKRDGHINRPPFGFPGDHPDAKETLKPITFEEWSKEWSKLSKKTRASKNPLVSSEKQTFEQFLND